MLDKNLLKTYIDTFFGYGKWQSDFWFVGLEEGGGNDLEEIEKRLNSWNSLGGSDLIDNKIHQTKIGHGRFFEAGNLQHTWRKLILTKLSFENKSVDRESIRTTQKTDWGHLNSNNLLIELFPLSSPKNSSWRYNEWTDLEFLASRDLYYEKVTSIRIDNIKGKIRQFRPKVVLFYGKIMQKHWDKIIGNDGSNEIALLNSSFKFIKIDGTCFIQSPHPASIYSNKFWIDLGIQIRQLSGD